MVSSRLKAKTIREMRPRVDPDPRNKRRYWAHTFFASEKPQSSLLEESPARSRSPITTGTNTMKHMHMRIQVTTNLQLEHLYCYQYEYSTICLY